MLHDKNYKKVRMLFKVARDDPQYAALAKQYKRLEAAFGDLTGNMTDEEQDIAWGFVCVSDQMNWRMLELICERLGIDPMKTGSDFDYGE